MQAERKAYEEWVQENYGMSAEEYEDYVSMLEETRPSDVVVEEIRAIFAEAYLEEENRLNNIGNEQGRISESVEGSNEVLLSEQSDLQRGDESVSEGGQGNEVSVRTDSENAASQEESGSEVEEEVEEETEDVASEEPAAEREASDVLGRIEDIAKEEERRKPLRARAREWEEKLGVKVRLMEDVADVKNASARRAILAGRKVTGWYDDATGEVYFYMPYLKNAEEVDLTYLHEVVAHKGLRQLLGEAGFNELCDKVYEMMSPEDRHKMLGYSGVANIADETERKRAAADEYMAHLAEETKMNPTVWDEIVEFVKRILWKLIGKKYNKVDVAEIIRESYINLSENKEQEGGNFGGETRFRFSRTPEEFDATQKEAVEKKGIVVDGLNEAVLDVVEVPRHDFTGRGIDAIHKAEKWANENIVGEHVYHKGLEDEFSYVIDNDAIGKFLSKSSTTESDNLGVHLAVLKKLPEVIDNSIEAEIHPDYKKVDKVRSIENGVNRDDLLVHRLYGAVDIDGKIYRAKTTIHEFRDKENKAYTYKITEVKLIVSGSTTSNARTNSTSISAAKVLENVEKSYEKGKKLLDESKKTRFRTLESEEIVKVPRSKVLYTADNIGEKLYKVSGKYMRALYGANGELGHVLKQGTAEINQEKAKQEYERVKGIFDYYRKELIGMKGRSTKAAQEVINELIADIDYSVQFYEDLSEGKDSWRTGDMPRFREVFHGSAADFDKFDHSKMGSGAGSQVFGWGTYVTDSEDIAKEYGDVALKGENKFSYVGDKEVGKWILADAEQLMDRNGSYEAVEKKYFHVPLAPNTALAQAVEFIKSTKKEDWQGNRYLYKINIPDVKRGNYIVYGNNVTDAAAKKVFDGIYERLSNTEEYDNTMAKKVLKEELDSLRDGYGQGKSGIWKDLYGDIASYLGTEKDASMFLRSLGYVGIKYPSGTIFGGKYKGSENYVIFDEKDLEINGHTRFRFVDGMTNDEIYDGLNELSGYSNGAYNLMNALEEYYGGRIVSASNGARHAIKNGLVPVPKGQYEGLNEEYHHFEFEDENGETFVKAVPFVEAEGVEENEGIRFRELEEVNAKFNERLFELDNDREQKDRVLRLGRPSEFLLDGGVIDADIEMEFDRFVRKSSESYGNAHPFMANDIVDLPKAINMPIAVFDSTNGKDKVILTELNKEGNNFIVAIKAVPRRRKGGLVLEVNEISTLYPKKAKGIVGWINNGLSTNVDKKKALEWLGVLRTNHGTELNSQELDSAAKIVEEFENPKLSEENIRFREADENQTMFREVDDPNVIAELEASPKRRGFRNVVRNEDGTFSSPMAYWLQSTTGGAATRVETAKFELGKWEEAEEHPELVDEEGKITLVKPNKGTVPVAYDPYIHNRLDPVNLQFKDAWKRDDLIYVETEVPTVDLESGYHAEKALLPVGVHSWSNGDLMLSKYDKPTRFVPWNEVADAWVERLDGKEVHFDVVPPALRSLLVERGVDIVAPHKGMGKDCNDAYTEWKESVMEGQVMFRVREEEKEGVVLDEVVRLEKELNRSVNVIDEFDALPEGKAKEAIKAGRKILGWYQDGKVYVYMPNTRGAEDVRATVYHEVVGHLGLRELLGERFGEFLNGVYMNVPSHPVWVRGLKPWSGDGGCATHVGVWI